MKQGRLVKKFYDQHYIGGQWVASAGGVARDVINPATEQSIGEVVLGTASDVDRAVVAARAAFETFSLASRDERVALLERVLAEYQRRVPDIAQAISEEMGAPIDMATKLQAAAGLGHLMATIAALRDFPFHEMIGNGNAQVIREPIGVAALITPWNWPMNQIVAKVAPALAAGNTVILKPSEQTPGCAHVFAEVIEAAGAPSGVFNLVHGDGEGVGSALARHPGIDMISITGSTRAGIMVAKNAADTVKRVHQELGGKSPMIVMPGSALDAVLPPSVPSMLLNSGQSCIAACRLLVHRDQYDEAVQVLAKLFAAQKVDEPDKSGTHIGPVSSRTQFERVQGYIQKGIDEGATLVAGGLGRPDGLESGYFVRPTVLSDVSNDMAVAQEEIFGPVVVVIPYGSIDEAVRIANDTPYGLGAYVSGDPEQAVGLVGRLRSGSVWVNSGGLDMATPFGGYKRSGNGREFGRFGIDEFTEVKAVIGAGRMLV